MLWATTSYVLVFFFSLSLFQFSWTFCFSSSPSFHAFRKHYILYTSHIRLHCVLKWYFVLWGYHSLLLLLFYPYLYDVRIVDVFSSSQIYKFLLLNSLDLLIKREIHVFICQVAVCVHVYICNVLFWAPNFENLKTDWVIWISLEVISKLDFVLLLFFLFISFLLVKKSSNTMEFQADKISKRWNGSSNVVCYVNSQECCILSSNKFMIMMTSSDCFFSRFFSFPINVHKHIGMLLFFCSF